MLLGSVLVFAALALLLYNQREQDRAAQASAEVMPQLVQAIQELQEEPEPTQPPEEPPAPTLPEDREMTVAKINGYNYIGFVGIPALELELPVMADWSYPKLQIAPCRFLGTTYGDDLVVMAHNYSTHFGRLSTLRTGDTVTFTDMEAVTITYEVVALDVLDPDAVEELTAGEYDLTLLTCTYGGKSRVTVRCDRVEESSDF